MMKKNIFLEAQHGFIGKWCVTQLIEFLDEMTDVQDKGKDISVVYFDFRKAFDWLIVFGLITRQPL